MTLNSVLAKMFKQMGMILEIKGESGFKINATVKVANILEDLVEDISSIEDLTSIDGVGKSSAEKIKQFIDTGKMDAYDTLVSTIPDGLLKVVKVQGIGPKTARRFWQEADVIDLESLHAAIDDGRLLALPRMGEKTIENIKDSLAFQSQHADRTRLGEALPIAKHWIESLSKVKGVTHIEYAGSLRRGKDTIGDIDLLVSADDPALVSKAFCNMESVIKILVQGDTKCSVRIEQGMQIDLRVVNASCFGAALLYFTGSKEHNVTLREQAIKQNKRLNEYGLFEDDGEAAPPQDRGIVPIAATTESSIYESLDLPWIPPEIREDRGELHVPNIPTLIEIKDIRCELHAHTTASDGHMSLDMLIEQAIKRGFHTIAVTDHSQSSTQANGLSPQRLKKHITAIHEANERYSEINVLAGSEVDILADGTLDYEDSLLEMLDIVVASPHAALGQSPQDATKRLIAAIEHPLVNIIGHPTGRIIQKRKGLEPDMHAVVQAAAEHNTALEINAHDVRLDLRDIHVKAAIDAGTLIAINTDAHQAEDFEQLQFGITTARRGWVTPSNCINCLDADAMLGWLGVKRDAVK